MVKIFLKPRREKALLHKHPWLFAGAIARVEGDPTSGSTIEVFDSHNTWLARGAYSPHSSIRVRIWTWDDQEQLDGEFFRRRIHAAHARRRIWLKGKLLSAYRVVHAESDGLPGLIVDRYGPYLVVQILCAGMEVWREEIIAALHTLPDVVGIMERSDVDVRSLEGLQPRKGVIWGEIPEEMVQLNEYGLKYWVDLHAGHKTGFYLDQHLNRRLFYELPEKGDVLNCFCYTGGFSISAAAGGAASVVSIDSSAAALELAQANVDLNNLGDSDMTWMDADVFKALRRFRDERRTFDTILLDPPRFAPTVSQAERAARGYKDINLLAFKLLRPGGRLMTFSCSGGISPALFQKIVADAALDANVTACIHASMGQPPDHPIGLNFPEGGYLKGLLCSIGED